MSEIVRSDGTKAYPITDDLFRRKMSNTPDFLELKKKEYHYVFVYGTLKVGGPLHGVLRGCPFLGDSRTATPGFTMYEYAKKFPVVQKASAPNVASGYIMGEVFVVPPRLFLEIDRIEDQGEMYNREEHFVFLYDQDVKSKNNLKPYIKAWMYIGNPEFWSNECLDKASMKVNRDTGKTYYEFFNSTFHDTAAPFDDDIPFGEPYTHEARRVG